MNRIQILQKYFDIKNCRCFSLYFNYKQQHKQIKNEYITIYKFPYIRQLSLINRLKYYQTIATTISTPGAMILSNLDYIRFGDFEVVAYTGKQ